MIVGSYRKLEIGSIHTKLIADSHHQVHRMPICVLRVATFEEWLAEVMALDPPPKVDEISGAQKCAFFYDVSID